MNLEAKVDSLSESIARIESKLDVVIAKQNSIPRLAARFDKKKSAEDILLDDVRDLIRYLIQRHPRSSFKDGELKKDPQD